jgi:glucose-6-phosphate isomerase
MKQRPFTLSISVTDEMLTEYDSHLIRCLDELKGQFLDEQKYMEMLMQNPVLYEVYDIKRPELAGELMYGITLIHPGKVGDEYFMTKGHFHNVIETAEIYYCLKGEGMMVMETPEGEWSVEELHSGRVLYIPPRWAHRSVNTGQRDDLVMFFAYPANAGHDYGTIKQQGFRKLVVERDGRPQVIDNPRWHQHER